MRRFLTAALALALTLSLAACGGGKEGESSPPYTVSQVGDMVQAGAFSEELEDLDGDVAFALYKLAGYGLNREDLKECAVVRSAGATCEEGAVLVFTAADKAETAEGALKDYVQSQIEANEDYRPAEIPKLKDALVSRRGESLLLVVANDLSAAKSVLS